MVKRAGKVTSTQGCAQAGKTACQLCFGWQGRFDQDQSVEVCCAGSVRGGPQCFSLFVARARSSKLDCNLSRRTKFARHEPGQICDEIHCRQDWRQKCRLPPFSLRARKGWGTRGFRKRRGRKQQIDRFGKSEKVAPRCRIG